METCHRRQKDHADLDVDVPLNRSTYHVHVACPGQFTPLAQEEFYLVRQDCINLMSSPASETFESISAGASSIAVETRMRLSRVVSRMDHRYRTLKSVRVPLNMHLEKSRYVSCIGPISSSIEISFSCVSTSFCSVVGNFRHCHGFLRLWASEVHNSCNSVRFQYTAP